MSGSSPVKWLLCSSSIREALDNPVIVTSSCMRLSESVSFPKGGLEALTFAEKLHCCLSHRRYGTSVRQRTEGFASRKNSMCCLTCMSSFIKTNKTRSWHQFKPSHVHLRCSSSCLYYTLGFGSYGDNRNC